MGHYATPELENEAAIEETYAIFSEEQVWYKRSEEGAEERKYVEATVAKQDSVL